MQQRQVTINLAEGLDARPCAQFVHLARNFASDITLEHNGRQADAKSPMSVLLLDVKQYDAVVLHARGEDQARALNTLCHFLSLEPAPAKAIADEKASIKPDLQQNEFSGTPVCGGLAYAPVFALFHDEILPERQHIAHSEVELALRRFQKVVASVQAEFVQERARKYLNRADQEILDALIDVVSDRSFIGEIERRIVECFDPVAATVAVGGELSNQFAGLNDPYLSARAEDIRGMTRLLASGLQGRTLVSVEDIDHPVIIVAEELSAWDFAKMPLRHVKGLVFTGSSPTSHVSIMAKTHAIPTLTGVEAERSVLEAASFIALDGAKGRVHLNPTPEAVVHFEAEIAQANQHILALQSYKERPAIAKNGREIVVAANLGSLKDADAAEAAGAQGVGLFRTELMFMEGRKPPEEQRQFEIYDALAQRFAPHQVIIRTLDVGGDKPVPGLAFPKETNPFLGWRGIRLCLDQPSVFKPQLKALLRASIHGNLAIMLPMIADVSEVHRTKLMLAECASELSAAGVPHAMPDLGIMIETPAAVFCAAQLAREVAFFSIGTNDLTQYVMAADRLSNKLSKLQEASHPAVMRAIAMVCEAAKEAGIFVSICGEAAARSDLIPQFLDMGVSKLSMSPEAILRAKKTIIEGGQG